MSVWKVPLLYRRTCTPMTSIDMESLLTIIYVLVDDWYKTEGNKLLEGKVGSKPVFSDSEMLTLMLAHEFAPYPGETQYVGYLRANYLYLFRIGCKLMGQH